MALSAKQSLSSSGAKQVFTLRIKVKARFLFFFCKKELVFLICECLVNRKRYMGPILSCGSLLNLIEIFIELPDRIQLDGSILPLK